MTQPVEWHPVELEPEEAPEGREFADPGWYDGDVALLNYLLQDLRVVVRQIAAGARSIVEFEPFEWDVHGLLRRTVVCDVEALLQAETRMIVGFFGDRRTETPGIDVDSTELDVVGEFRQFPGIVSYSSAELLGGQWANLVVHTEPDDRQGWRHSAVHIAAAEDVAPRMYHNVRIHNGCIVGGPIGSRTVVLESTKYWDYDVAPVWHAHRCLPGGLSTTMEGPIDVEPVIEPL